MNNVLKNVRKNNIKLAVRLLLPVVLLAAVLFALINETFIESENVEIVNILIILFVGLFCFFIYKTFFKSVYLIIKPIKADIFRKYGSPQKIQKIVEEIEKTKIYEDRHLIISKKYISDKTDYSKILLCNDIIGVHKLVHSLNGRVDYYKIVLIDKYNDTITYQYNEKEENLVDQLLLAISSKCPNAEFGYDKKEWEHIKKNSIKLPKEIKKDEQYKCDNCGAIVSEDALECPNCGELFEDD